jgi:hypothetical protein
MRCSWHGSRETRLPPHDLVTLQRRKQKQLENRFNLNTVIVSMSSFLEMHDTEIDHGFLKSHSLHFASSEFNAINNFTACVANIYFIASLPRESCSPKFFFCSRFSGQSFHVFIYLFFLTCVTRHVQLIMHNLQQFNIQQLCLSTFIFLSPPWSSGQISCLQIQRPGFDSRSFQIFWEVVGLERGPPSLMGTIEELLGRKSRGSGLENREYGRADLSRWPRGILYPQKLALISPTAAVARSVQFARGVRQQLIFLCRNIFCNPFVPTNCMQLSPSKKIKLSLCLIVKHYAMRSYGGAYA